MKNTPLDEVVENLKRIAELLIPHTYPLASPDDEEAVLPLKSSRVCVDGYWLAVCYSRAKREKHLIEVLQIESVHAIFLPFNVVLKVARIFLGDQDLAYAEFYKRDKKVYCWAKKSKGPRTVPPNDLTRQVTFEGFNFRVMTKSGNAF